MMKSTRRKLSPIKALIGTVLLSVASATQAGLILKFEDITDSNNVVDLLTIADNDANDMSIAAGSILYSGGLGNFNIHTASALSFEPTPADSRAELNFVSLLSANSQGKLQITLTDTDYLFSNQTMDMLLVNELMASGVFGVVTTEGFLDPTNAAFGTDVNALNVGPQEAFLPGLTTVSRRLDPLGDGNEFSLTEVISIDFTTPGQVAFVHKQLTAIPEPGSLALLGLGLAGLGIMRRRKQKSDA